MLHYEDWGSDKTYPHMAVGWTWAFDTPFKWTKQVASHFGGTRQGMAISWPGHITDVGGIRTQFHHVIDIVPTILEATGIKAPEMVNGIQQKPIEGVSMAYTFDKANANAPSKHDTQYFEMVGNRAIYHDGWVAATTPPSPPWMLGATMPALGDYQWELYNVAKDYSENNDLAAQDAGQAEGNAGVVPDRGGEIPGLPAGQLRLCARRDAASERDRRENGIHLHGCECRHSLRQCAQHSGQGLHHHRRDDRSQRRRGRNDRDAGRTLRRLRTLSAKWQAGLRLQPARYGAIPLGRRHRRQIGEDLFGRALTPGKHTLVFDFKYDGPGPGKGGTGVFTVDGRELARKTIAHTIPLLMTIDETFDVGLDTGTGVDDSYKLPFKFTGTIDKLTFKLGPSQMTAADKKAAEEAYAKAND